MRQLLDTVWQRRGTSWLWDEEARNQVCAASEVWSLRQFLLAKGSWPNELSSNCGKTLVVAGLDGSLDLLTPEDAEVWLDGVIKPAILSFQDDWGSDGALVFWLPGGHARIRLSGRDLPRHVLVAVDFAIPAANGGRRHFRLRQ